jgi:hypothetical protein
MCLHKFYIFMNCGHSFFAPGALIPCAIAEFSSLQPSKDYQLSKRLQVITQESLSSTCTPKAHPYRTIRINNGLCLDCEVRRKYLLAQAEQELVNVVQFEESRWRVQYVNDKASKKQEKWRAWGEPDDTVSVEMVARQRQGQRQKAKGGRVGFSEDSLPGSPKTPDMLSKRTSSRKSHRS